MKKQPKWYIDIDFWLLFVIVNLSGNLCFTYVLPYKPFVILTFCTTTIIAIYKNKLKYENIFYVLIWITILCLQILYISDYSLSSNIHFFLKLATGIIAVSIIGERFVTYYCNIILFFSVISLICFTFNSFGVIIPYIKVENTLLDGGYIMRVTSVLYTQLYSPSNEGLTLRNCGPFWEPGAFQGFVNLALFLKLFINKGNTKKWLFTVLIFIATIITTFSTGGYIVLFINIIFYILITRQINPQIKIIVLSFAIITALHLYFTLGFLNEKISNDSGRLDVSFNDLGDGVHFLFGYSLNNESFVHSEISSASSIFNLIRYVGFSGLILYFIPIIRHIVNLKNLIFLTVLILVLMNEPFITTGPFWWSVPFLTKYFNNSNKHELIPKI